MTSNLSKLLRLAVAFCLFFSVFYIFALWLFVQVVGPDKDSAELITLNGKVVRVANVDQNFTQDIYFWGCPPRAGDGYDVSSSTDSNKGPSSEEHLASLKERISIFLVHHPHLTHEKVPTEIITASSFDLNPHVSPRAVYTQAKHIADAHGRSEEKVAGIVNSHTEKSLLGVFGTGEANVLKLSIALSQASSDK